MTGSAAEYVARADARIRSVLAAELTVVPSELEARIAEAGFAGSDLNIDPHHITTALRSLISTGDVVREEERTRGGRMVATLRMADVGRKKTAAASSARRKRLLMGRYLGWAHGTKRHPHGLIGPAGEAAVRGGILLSGALQPARPDAGEVGSILGVNLPGAADSAGYMVPLIDGIPQPPVTVIVEVKNLRSWIYPSSPELYQVLHKAVVVQVARPGVPIVPILICRRTHTTTYWMAHQLGFIVVPMDTQFVGEVDPNSLDEVRNELHFNDIRVGIGPSMRVKDRLSSPGLVQKMPSIAQGWERTALNEEMAASIAAIRKATSTRSRLRLVDEFRTLAKDSGHQGGW